MKADEPPTGAMHPAHRSSLYQRITPQAAMHQSLPLHKEVGKIIPRSPLPPFNDNAMEGEDAEQFSDPVSAFPNDSQPTRHASGNYNLPLGYTPFLETVNQDIKSSQVTPMRLPGTLTTEDFTRAVAVATVSALRHQGSIVGGSGGSISGGHKPRAPPVDLVRIANGGLGPKEEDDEDNHAGHEGPSWTRGVSAGVLLGCTLLYAIIAGEFPFLILNVFLEAHPIDARNLGRRCRCCLKGIRDRRKVLGIDVVRFGAQYDRIHERHVFRFEWEYSFIVRSHGIRLPEDLLMLLLCRMEIGSAYALQVCLLQIPAMVAFSAFYRPDKMGDVIDTFT